MMSLGKSVVALIAALLIAVPSAMIAQEPSAGVPALPDPLTPEAIQALVARLSDAEVRSLLLEELDARAVDAAADETPPEMVGMATEAVGQVTGRIGDSVAGIGGQAGPAMKAFGAYFASMSGSELFLFLFVLTLTIAAGYAVDVIYSRRIGAWAARRGFAPAPGEPIPAFPQSVFMLARRFLRDAGGALLSLAVAVVILSAVLPAREARVGMTIAIWLIFMPRIFWTVLRFFLSPDRPDLRLVDTDDWTARFLMRHVVAVTVLLGMIETFVQVLEEIGEGEVTRGLGFGFNVLIFLYLAYIFVRARSGLLQIVRGGQQELTAGERFVVRAYPAYSIIAIIAIWVAATAAWAMGDDDILYGGKHLLSLALLLVTPMCDALIRGTVHALVRPMRGTGRLAEKAYAGAYASYIRIARVVIFGLIVIALSQLWGISLFSVATTGMKEEVAERVIGALLILVAGYIVWEVVRLLINRKLAGEQSSAEDPEATLEIDEGPMGGGAASRLGTILPPISWTLQAVVIIITVLTALGHLGINVTPLLAGAGVAGIAIGFGAQKLVADVVSGIFFLIDDAFRRNEYINVGGIEGTVEKIALRSMLLRQSDGPINCVPYSNINSITNFGRDWGTMKFAFTVPFDTDIEKVRKIFKKIGQELADNPEYKDSIIQPFKSKGVREINDVGIVMRGKFMFRPEAAKQFLIKRDIYRRVQEEFAKQGIQFARREVRVSVDTHGAPLSDETVQSVAAGAVADAAPDKK